MENGKDKATRNSLLVGRLLSSRLPLYCSSLPSAATGRKGPPPRIFPSKRWETWGVAQKYVLRPSFEASKRRLTSSARSEQTTFYRIYRVHDRLIVRKWRIKFITSKSIPELPEAAFNISKCLGIRPLYDCRWLLLSSYNLSSAGIDRIASPKLTNWFGVMIAH